MNWNEIWNAIINFLSTTGLTILYGVLALLGGWLLVKLILALLKKILRKTTMDTTVQSFIGSILKFVLYVLLILIVLQAFGIPITGLIALISAAGLAVALALKDSMSNLANGIILITTKPFIAGDYVSINSTEGKVLAISMLTTKLCSVDNKTIILPNSTVLNGTVINYSAQENRRVDFTFSIAYTADVDKAKEVALQVMHSNGMVLLTPEPVIYVNKMSESSIDLVAKCWCDNADYWDVYYYIMDNVFNEYKRNKIEIPYNQLDVHLIQKEVAPVIRQEPLPQRVEKVKKDNANDEITIFGLKTKLHKKSKKTTTKK